MDEDDSLYVIELAVRLIEAGGAYSRSRLPAVAGEIAATITALRDLPRDSTTPAAGGTIQ